MIAAAVLFSLRVGGLDPATLAVGGAITAVVIGLAAQQTLGNLIAGMVLIAARPFRVGDRVRLQAGAVAGQIEGVVGSLGLLYTTFAQGQDSIMVPNNVVLSAAVVPLREPAAVDLRARLRPDVRPSAVQSLLEDAVQTPVRGEPRIALEELDSDEVVVRITATPVEDRDGPRLADEVLAGLASVTREVEEERPGAAVAALTDRAQDAARRRYARLPRLPARHVLGDLRAAEAALQPRGELGREPGEGRARAQRQRRDVDLRAVALDRPHDGRGDVLGRAACRRTRGSFDAGVVEHAASRMKPGSTTETPTPRRAGPRAARARSRAARTSSPSRREPPPLATLPDSEETNTRCPAPRAAIGSASRRAITIGARRLTASARSMSSTEKRRDVPAARAAPALATSTSTSPASAEQAVDVARSAEVGRDARGRRSRRRAAPARRRGGPSATSTAPRAASARAIAVPEAAGRARHAGRSGRAAPSGARAYGNTATVAVKLCRKCSPPTGPISPAAKNPAAGAPSSASATASASWSGAPNMSRPAAVAGEHQRARRRRGRRARSSRISSASRRSRSALSGVAGVQAHDLAGVDVGGDGDLARRRVGADQAAHEEVALHVVGLVGVDHDADQQPALRPARAPRRTAPRSSRAASRAPAGRPARR